MCLAHLFSQLQPRCWGGGFGASEKEKPKNRTIAVGKYEPRRPTFHPPPQPWLGAQNYKMSFSLPLIFRHPHVHMPKGPQKSLMGFHRAFHGLSEAFLACEYTAVNILEPSNLVNLFGVMAGRGVDAGRVSSIMNVPSELTPGLCINQAPQRRLCDCHQLCT